MLLDYENQILKKGVGKMVTKELEEKILSPQEVRNILNTDNREIIRLCKKASIVPRKNNSGQTYFSYNEVQNLKNVKDETPAKNTALSIPQSSSQVDSQAAITSLLSTLESLENNITSSLSKVIDEKLDGMDEVVVELIRCKTENETLRQKINELNKDNYHLKNKVKSYKSIGMGFYIKKTQDDFSL